MFLIMIKLFKKGAKVILIMSLSLQPYIIR